MLLDDLTKMIFVDNLNFDKLRKEEKLPLDVSCIYFLFNDWELVYIGETKNLRYRIYHHYYNLQCVFPINVSLYTDEYYKPFNKVGYIPLNDLSYKLRWYLEQSYIDEYEPKFNKERLI